MKLKICGLKNPGNILEVLKLQPEYIGLIFYEQSKRFVEEDPAILEAMKNIGETKVVGVFVNETQKNILEKVKRYKLDYIQLHGNESPEFCENLSGYVKIIKAFLMKEDFDFEITKPYESHCKYFLFDAYSAAFGGSGQTFDLEMLKRYRSLHPFFLSGGIGLEEIKNIQSLKHGLPEIHALDVNSRFEIEPGIKNINLLKQLKCIK